MQWLGDRAIRFPRPAVSARAIVHAARTWPGAIDVVVTRDEVAVYFDREPAIDPSLVDALATLDDVDVPVRDVVLHASYDGTDLDHLAAIVGVDVDAIIAMHAGQTYAVEMMGFAPGFAYLTGLDPRLAALPRRATPRTRVPAGSLAIAGGYTAVYPFDSPGGWHLIGRVDEAMFTTGGALLQLGDRVRFVRR
jgi:KipI family sensor histidine kinase inhibitor